MKSLIKFILSVLPLVALLASCPEMNAQLLKKLGQKAEKAAERTVERRVERETEKKTDAALDSILQPGSGKKTTPKTTQTGGNSSENDNSNSDASQGSSPASPKSDPKSIALYSKFDFVPGDKILLYDDFSVDNIGDFPAKWNTNGSGQVVQFEGNDNKWFFMSNKSFMVPDFNADLTENYTIEFDVKGLNISKNTSSLANLNITLSDNAKLTWGDNYANVVIGFCQYIAQGVRVSNSFKGDADRIQNTISRDFRNVLLDVAHISIAVNGQRYRMWINESKVVDLPRFISSPELIKNLKFNISGFNEDKYDERLLITNLKIAAGGSDLRSKLLKEGKFSTTGILFDSGSDKIKPESYGTLKQIADALKQESNMKILIVGHTDADGNDSANLELSKKRAASVKATLTTDFGVSAANLQTDGKGKNEPVGNNSTTEGKAQNRRVEFIKQ